MIRLFVALDLPSEIKIILHRLCSDLAGARWVPVDQLHLTVRFIGEVDSDLFREIQDTLHTVKVKPITLTFQGIGFFPSLKRARILWIGVKKNDQLIQLHNEVESAVTNLGLEPENKKFVPHITLARLKSTSFSSASRFLVSNSPFSSSPFPVQCFSLYSSILTSKGAIHQQEGRYLFHS